MYFHSLGNSSCLRLFLSFAWTPGPWCPPQLSCCALGSIALPIAVQHEPLCLEQSLPIGYTQGTEGSILQSAATPRPQPPGFDAKSRQSPNAAVYPQRGFCEIGQQTVEPAPLPLFSCHLCLGSNESTSSQIVEMEGEQGLWRAYSKLDC